MHLMRKADRSTQVSAHQNIRAVRINVVRSCGVPVKPSKQFLQTQGIAASIYKTLIDQGWTKIPPGWRVVPIEPAPEQIAAGGARHTFEYEQSEADRMARDVYLEMVKAAPAPPSLPPDLITKPKGKAR